MRKGLVYVCAVVMTGAFLKGLVDLAATGGYLGKHSEGW